MEIKEYRHSFILFTALQTVKEMGLRQLSNLHPTVNGSVVIVHDEEKDQTYILRIDIVKSQVEVKEKEELTFNQLMTKWGKDDRA